MIHCNCTGRRKCPANVIGATTSVTVLFVCTVVVVRRRARLRRYIIIIIIIIIIFYVLKYYNHVRVTTRYASVYYYIVYSCDADVTVTRIEYYTRVERRALIIKRPGRRRALRKTFARAR